MKTIDLKYGRSSVPFTYDESKFDIVGHEAERKPLSDIEIGQALDDPIDSPPLVTSPTGAVDLHQSPVRDAGSAADHAARCRDGLRIRTAAVTTEC